MKRKFLTRINWLLGSLSLLLASCHTQKQVPANDKVMVLYGVSYEDYCPVDIDSLSTDRQPIEVQQDSSRLQPRQEPQIRVKYGVRMPNEEK